MAMVVPQYERRQVVQAVNPVGVTPARSGVGQVAQGVADVAQTLDQWQADVDEGDAKQADTRYSDLVRKTLYDDSTGYLYAQGGDALARRKEAADTLQKGYDEILGGLSPRAREAAQSALESRRQSAITSVDKHAGGERITYLNGQADARVKSAVDDAVIDPAYIDRSMKIARAEISDAGKRNGWSPEETAAKISDAEGAIHGGIVTRLSTVDPQQALDYLNANRNSMKATDVTRLEAVLVPEAKRRRGRETGRSLARGSDGVVIPDSYYGSIRSSESGGNWNAANPNSSARGGYQFLRGTWEQLRYSRPDLGLTANGRGDPVQEDRAIRAFTQDNARTLIRGGVAISNGTLYAAHFLGAGGALKVLTAPMSAAVSNIVGPAVTQANGFLDGMTVADFISWAEKKGGATATAPMPIGGFVAPAWDQPNQRTADPVTQLLSIEDPDERAAALQEYQLWTGQQAARQKAAQDAAQQAAFALIETGGDVDALSLDQKVAIGQEGMSSLRTYQTKVQSRDPIETDPALYVELSRQAVDDPKAFAARDPLQWRDRLSDEDFKAFVKKQSEAGRPPSPDSATTIGTINSITSDLITVAGIDPKDRKGAAQVAKLQENLLRWSAQYQGQHNGEAPTHLQLRDQANAMMMPVILDPAGWNNKQGGTRGVPAFSLDFEGVSPDQIRDGSLTIGGVKLDQDVIEDFVIQFQSVMGRVPTPEEVVNGLAAAAAGGADLSEPASADPEAAG